MEKRLVLVKAKSGLVGRRLLLICMYKSTDM